MIEIRTRAEWGARAPLGRNYITMPTPRLWVHHSADDRQGDAAVRDHQDYHMDVKGWLDIGYSFLIGDDGTIFEGRGEGIAGGHTEGENFVSHGICLLGNFETHAPTVAALASLIELAVYGREHGWWAPTLGGHRDAPGAQTACPGRYLYDHLPNVRARVSAGTGEDFDMDDATFRRLVGEGFQAAIAIDDGDPGIAVPQIKKRVAEGVQQAIVKGGISEASFEKRVEEAVIKVFGADTITKLREFLSDVPLLSDTPYTTATPPEAPTG